MSKYCEVCKQTFDGNTNTIELMDDKSKLHISGHDVCVDSVYKKIKSLKGSEKKSIEKILKEIKFKK